MSIEFTNAVKYDIFQLMSNDLKWGVKQRFIQIEMCLYWKSRLTTNMLIETFDIHRRQAGLDIAKYQDIAVDNIVYNPSKRCYEPTSTFKPLFIQKTTAEYLHWVQSQLISTADELPLSFRHIQGMPLELPEAQVKHSVLKAITYIIDHNEIRHGGSEAASQTFKEKKGSLIHFVDESVTSSTFVPYALAKVGNQWFIRGMDLPSSVFILIEVTSIFSAEVVDLINFTSVYNNTVLNNSTQSDMDESWNEVFQVTIKINPKLNLSPRMKLHIEECYQLTQGSFAINMRTALLDIYTSMLDQIKHSNGDSLFIYSIENMSW